MLDALERQFVAECRQWFADIRLVTFYAGRTAMLCYCYNHFTRPTAYRTDREHRIASAVARWCRRQLASRGGWHEQESGRLWC